MQRHNNRGRPENSLYGHYARQMFPSNPLTFPVTHRDIDYNDTRGYSLIFNAVHQGNLNIVHSLLQELKESAEMKLKGRNLMHIASARGHEQIVCLLRQRNFRIDERDRDENSPLHLAIKNNHIDVVQLLANENTVNLKNSSKETSLHIATENNQCSIVEILLKNGANTKEQDAKGNTPLHLAVKKRKPNLKIINLLMDHGASADEFCHDELSPLYHAVRLENIEVLNILVKRAEIDNKNKHGMSPLVLAVQKNNTNIVRKLFEADRAVLDVFYFKKEMTPLHRAAKNGNLEIVKLLVSNGYGSFNVKNADNETPLYLASINGHLDLVEFFIENGCNIEESTTPDNKSLIHACAINGQLEVLKFFRNYGEKIDGRTVDGETPLHLAITHGHLEIVKYLLECGVDANAKISKENSLHLAIKAGHISIIKELLNHIDVNSLATKDYSSLAFAVKSRNKKIVQLFLTFGVRDELRPENVENAVHAAAKIGDDQILKLLLDANCSPHIECRGKKPIHTAAIFGQTRIMELLISKGADIDARTKFAETPLHLAAASGRSSSVKYLLNCGADPTLLTNRNLTVLDYALDRGRHTALIQKRPINSLSYCFEEHDVWPLHPYAFEKYLDITEMLLANSTEFFIKNSYFNENGTFDIKYLNCAGRIRVVKEDSNSQLRNIVFTLKKRDVEFKPEIMRCIFNYGLEMISEKHLETFTKETIKQNDAEVLRCIFEYGCKVKNFKMNFSECDYETFSIIIDYIDDINIIFDLLGVNEPPGPRIRDVRVPPRLDRDMELDLLVYQFRLLPDSPFKSLTPKMLKLLIARLVQLRSISKEHSVPEPKELEILNKNNLHDWYLDCEVQIMSMREVKIDDNFDVSYYNILSQPVDKIANFVRREELLKIVEINYGMFPGYSDLLKISIEKGKERSRLIDSSADCLLNVIQKNYKIQIPSLVVDNIFKYLTVIDLRRVEQAGKFIHKKRLYTRPFAGRKNKIYN